MRIVVLGGSGYIGSHTARMLRGRGHDVVIYDNLSTGHAFLSKGLEVVNADIAETAILAPVLEKADAVMHFAAHAYVGESCERPRKYFSNNIEAGLAMLNAVVDSGVRCFVFSSTCAVYGVPARLPIGEETSREPVNPYGASKLFFEHALKAYGRAYGLRFVSLRYFNAAGADESGEIGELHDPETHLIPLALEAAAGARPELEIYGDDYSTPDGTCIRDYIHVNDLAEAHALALDYLACGGRSIELNLGTGRGHSVQEVLRAIESIAGKVPTRVVPRRPGDPAVLVADPARAEYLLQWKANRSLEHSVKTAWNWMQTRRSKPIRSKSELSPPDRFQPVNRRDRSPTSTGSDNGRH
jgi:UDP-glucose-4-epimerase GalE